MKKILIMLTLTLGLFLTSCEPDDYVYIDCDCGEVTGWTPSTVTIYSDCGGYKTFYDYTTPVALGDYICY